MAECLILASPDIASQAVQVNKNNRSRIEAMLSQGRRGSFATELGRTRLWFDSARLEEFMDAMRPWLRSTLAHQQAGTYINRYAGWQVEKSPPTRYPFCGSADTVFPITLDTVGQTVIHWADNIALCYKS